tara:strand:- start:447 stop:2210 length:1764 start_codon:yes stop_codon:yes gene_type:complete
MLWADTSNNILKMRNSANDAWINLFSLAGGVDVDAASTFSEDVTFEGASANIVFDKSDNQLEFADNAKATFGSSGDLEIFHDASDSILNDAGTGSIKLQLGGSTKAEVVSGGFTVTGTVTATTFSGNATTATTATNANHISVADNESTNENNLVPFIEDASATGNVGLESDGDFTYNPSTGTVTATKFVGDGSGLTGLSSGGVSSDSQENVVAGGNAGDSFSGTDATSNTLFGHNAGTSITDGDTNTAFGHHSLRLGNVSNCVAIGKNALENNTASKNTAVGTEALAQNTSGSNNAALGYRALMSQTTAFYNTAVGYQALQNIDASRNTAVGYNALQTDTAGRYNVAIGSEAASGANGSGNNYNHAMGYRALRYAEGGSNQAVGTRALQQNTSGYSNNAFGYQALDSVTTGIRNIGIGSDAGDVITTGGNNIIIGRGSDPSAADADVQIVIGNSIVGKGNSTAFIGGSLGAYNEANGTAWTTTSDERIKKNIVDNNSGLNIINQIQIRNFEYRTEEEIVDFENPKAAVVEIGGVQLGVIAQELEKILPECVTTQSTGVKTVDSDNITWYLVNAVKELSAKVTALEAG